MSRLLTITSVLALAIATPAVAQQADPMAQPPVPDAPVSASPEITPSPTPAEPSATPATPATAPEAALTQESQVTALVETEFPSYDADKTGELNQSEFTTWVLALQTKAAEVDANAKKMDDAGKAKWAKAAFASADTDKSKKISKAEVVKFLLG